MASTNFQSRIPSSSSSSSSTTKYIPLHKTQLHPRMLSPPIPNPIKSRHNNKPLLLIICLSLLPFLLYLLSLYHSLHLPSPATFGLVIEIAHSRSQIRVFRSLNEVSGTPFSGESSDSKWVRTGTSWAGPEEVGQAVLKLVEFAMEKVPSSEWKVTKVQLMVTAAGVDDQILEECRRILRSSVFLFRDDWASVLGDGGCDLDQESNGNNLYVILSQDKVVYIQPPYPALAGASSSKHWGQDEGLYNWVAVNYALGYIGNKPHETAGVIVLGRSAMQVSYASSESPASKFSRVIRMPGVSYNLYAQSLKQFGQDAVWKLLHEKDSPDLTSSSIKNKRFVSNPCIPRGFELTSHASDEKLVKSHAAGNFSTCKSELMTLLNRRQGNCTELTCGLAPSILNELERKPHPQQRFFLSSQFQGLVPKVSVSRVEAVGDHFCEDYWENLKRQHDIDDIDLSRSCFSNAFMAILFQHSFGIPFDDQRVEFAAGSTPVDWRLGAFLAQTIVEPLEKEVEDHGNPIVGNESVTSYFLLVALLVFVLVAAFFVLKLRKPQLKTIYDLEKGRYIVTRVPR